MNDDMDMDMVKESSVLLLKSLLSSCSKMRCADPRFIHKNIKESRDWKSV